MLESITWGKLLRLFRRISLGHRHLALGVLPDGTRDVLGIWIEPTEGAEIWLKVFNALKTRGIAGILIAVVDGLESLADAIEVAFPKTTVQTCIAHLIRSSLE